MSGEEVVRKILQKLDREEKTEEVLDSPQTEFEDGKLKSIDLSDLNLESIPEDLFTDFTSLEKIHASFNNITSLPANLFSGLNKIKFINFYGNNLSDLPDDIFEGLDEVEWLDLRSNKLEKLPVSLGKLDSLNYLYLQNNPLSEHQDFNWAADYHSRRDVRKFIPEFQEAMGLEVTVEKPLTREERARRAKERREQKEKENN